MCNPLAVDGQMDPEVHAINAASTALLLSEVPWSGPVAAVRVGLLAADSPLAAPRTGTDALSYGPARSGFRFVLNPNRLQRRESRLDLLVAANARREVVMLECSANQVFSTY